MRTTTIRTAVLAAAIGVVSAANAQPEPQPLSINALGGGVYWTEGGVGSNTGIIVGDDGVILIDAKMTAESVQEISAEVANMTSKPITHILLTHSDGDHVNGLPYYDEGITIVAQENCRTEMEEAVAANPQMAALGDYLPEQTVGSDETVTLSGVRMRLLNTGPAHTAGDLIIYLPEQRIAFAGDLLTPLPILPFPYVHLEKQGSIMGWMDSAEAMLALDAESYVSGHGPVQSKAQLQTLLDNTRERVGEIRSLIDDGKSLDEIRAMTAEPPIAPGLPPDFEGFAAQTYKEFMASGQ